MARRSRTSPLVVVTAVAGIAMIVAGASALSGSAGSALKNGEDYACLVDSTGTPDLGEGHNPESVIAQGSWSLVPLGVACNFIATDTGERFSVRPSPLPTVLIVGGAFIGCFAVMLARRHRRADAPEPSD